MARYLIFQMLAYGPTIEQPRQWIAIGGPFQRCGITLQTRSTYDIVPLTLDYNTQQDANGRNKNQSIEPKTAQMDRRRFDDCCPGVGYL